MNREDMKKLARERHKQRRKVPEPKQAGRTGGEILKILLDEEEKQQAQEESSKPQISLYLKENVNPAERDFTKYPNEIHRVMAEHFDKPSQGVIYTYLWRKSWGYGRNFCRVGYAEILKSTCARSRWEVIQAMTKLKELKFIIQALNEDGNPDTTQAGTIYRVIAPTEIMDGKTEEGVLLSSIPDNGILFISILDNNSIDMQNTDKQHTSVLDDSILDNNIPGLNFSNIGDPDKGVDIQHTELQHTFKEDILKDTLSHIIDLFYTGINQKRTSKAKRERAKEDILELLQEGFTEEEIKFAVEWTIKNAKEKPYDFSIIKHTIGEAQKYHEAVKKAKRKQSEAEAIKKQEDCREAKIAALRADMTKKQLADLTARAKKEILESGEYKEQFITDQLIRAKENEMLAQCLKE